MTIDTNAKYFMTATYEKIFEEEEKRMKVQSDNESMILDGQKNP